MTSNNFKIGIDARSISNRICGVSRVATCLIEALSQIDAENRYIIYVDSIVPSVNLGENFEVKLTHCSRKNPIHDIKFYLILKRDRLDLFHSMHSWLPQFIPKGIKVVVTIHDIFSITDPQFFVKYRPFHKFYQLYFKYLTASAVKRAEAVVTVSNYSKDEIRKYFPVADRKIKVIYDASGFNCKRTNKGSRLIRDEYFLYVGNCRSYKNVEVLIEGFSIFLKMNKDHKIKLVMAGNDPCEHIKTLVSRMGIGENIIFLLNPSDDDVGNLYQNAVAFVFPSKQEGFGIPVLEAMNARTPVIISDAEALVEVAGDAAMIFKRDNPQELALALERILHNNFLRQELIEKGYNRASQFTWELSAVKLKNLYLQIINRRGVE